MKKSSKILVSVLMVLGLFSPHVIVKAGEVTPLTNLSPEEKTELTRWAVKKMGQSKNPFCWKKTYGRTAGTPLTECGDKEKDGALCYPRCKADYNGVGPVCWENCRAGYTNDGATCRKDVHIYGKKSYGRGAGSPMTCKKELEKDGALCYPYCKTGYYGVGPVCWEKCPSTHPKDCGAGCSTSGKE